MDETDERGSCPSPMLYDGGLRIGDAAQAVEHDLTGVLDKDEAARVHSQARAWDHYRDHPPIMCPDPRYAAGLRNRAACPFCGQKGVMLAGDRTLREFGYDTSDKAAAILAEALRQIRDIFRRHQVSLETVEARARAQALADEWNNHRKHQCPQCDAAARRRRWSGLCPSGAELRGLVIEAKAELARQVELDKHPAPGQEAMF